MHDPAWWWVKASNLGTLSGVAVRFSLAHDSFEKLGMLYLWVEVECGPISEVMYPCIGSTVVPLFCIASWILVDD